MPIDASTIRSAEKHLSRKDQALAALIRRHGPCTLGAKKRDPFHTLATSIISQQLSSKAADTIASRVETLVGSRGRLKPEHLRKATQEQLRGCGLSNSKAKWLLAIAQTTHSGALSFRSLASMSEADAVKTLDALPGVGQWTAEMFLIFALDKLDIFSMGDVGLRRAVNRLYNGGRKLSDRRTQELAERWAPYRSVASWYLWRMTDGD